MYEYHTHTTNSPDSRVKMHEYCERAIAIGIEEVAFTDHVDHDPADRGCGHNNYPTYMADIAACRAEYGDRLTILAAAEIDWNRQIAPAVRAYLADKSFDFIICSVHWINGEYLGERVRKHPSIEVYRQYLDEIEALVTTETFFHVIGHFDLGKRYDTVNGRIDVEHNRAQLGRIFDAMAASGTGLDLNTSSVRTAAGEPMPGADILRLFRAHGGAHVTIGSDTHILSTFGTNIDVAVRTLREAGWTTASHIANGRLVAVPLERIDASLRLATPTLA
ncbi:MAG: histidinol-phosphatase HisJ family protein [Thermomicrobia bacterium]|nr:histidinol-phosphatase HisJ family protein [Thermomicrobia bacterium]